MVSNQSRKQHKRSAQTQPSSPLTSTEIACESVSFVSLVRIHKGTGDMEAGMLPSTQADLRRSIERTLSAVYKNAAQEDSIVREFLIENATSSGIHATHAMTDALSSRYLKNPTKHRKDIGKALLIIARRQDHGSTSSLAIQALGKGLVQNPQDKGIRNCLKNTACRSSEAGIIPVNLSAEMLIKAYRKHPENIELEDALFAIAQRKYAYYYDYDVDETATKALGKAYLKGGPREAQLEEKLTAIARLPEDRKNSVRHPNAIAKDTAFEILADKALADRSSFDRMKKLLTERCKKESFVYQVYAAVKSLGRLYKATSSKDKQMRQTIADTLRGKAVPIVLRNEFIALGKKFLGFNPLEKTLEAASE